MTRAFKIVHTFIDQTTSFYPKPNSNPKTFPNPNTNPNPKLLCHTNYGIMP